MSALFEILDWQQTPMGVLSLRRRRELVLDVDVFEVMLGDEHLMSSLFTAGELALANLSLAETPRDELDVVVGGLGLGYTAGAALADDRIRTLDVVEALEPVIDWHERRLLPASPDLVDDGRCNLVHGDFFALMADGAALGPDGIERHDAILLDIDHTPSFVLDSSHEPFYTEAGLHRVVDRLTPGGVFGLWSDVADDAFLQTARQVFASCDAHEVRFPNHHTGGESSNVIYLAHTAA